jgi:hypothetical protein
VQYSTIQSEPLDDFDFDGFYRKPKQAAKICFTASGYLQDFPATSGQKSCQLEKNLAHY